MMGPPPGSTLFPYTTLFRSPATAKPTSRSASAPRAAPGSRSARAKRDRKSTRLNSSHVSISYAVFCLKKKNPYNLPPRCPNAALAVYLSAVFAAFDRPIGATARIRYGGWTTLLCPAALAERGSGRFRVSGLRCCRSDDGPATGIYTLSLHDALPISGDGKADITERFGSEGGTGIALGKGEA